MVKRYRRLHVSTEEAGLGAPAGQEARLAQAVADCAPAGVQKLVDDFVTSVTAFEAFDNVTQPFCPRRRPPVAAKDELWRTNDVSGRLDPESAWPGSGELVVHGASTLAYIDRELFPMRIVNGKSAAERYSHRVQTADKAASDNPLPMVRLDLLLCSADGRPVVGEVKTPTDVDQYYAVIQALTAASQLVTRNQYARLCEQYEHAGFRDADSGDTPQVDIAILSVDPEHCGPRSFSRPAGAKYRPLLDARGEELAESLMNEPALTQYVRRISFITLRLDEQAQLAATAR